MKTLLMRAWRRFGAYGLALAAALATAWAVREHVGQGEPEPVAANAPVVERLVAAEDLAAGTRLDESHLQRRQVPAAWAPRASLDPLAAQALLGAVLSADIDAGEIILPASAGPTRRAGVDGACAACIASRNARLECDRRRSRAVGWPAARGRQRRRLRILCPRRQAQRRSGAVGGRVLSVGAPADDGAPDTANAMLAVRPEDALRFVAARQGGILTAMLRHRDDAVAVGDEDQADPAALQGMPAESSGGRRCHPLRRPAGRPGAARCGRRIRRRGRRGCDMALNRYRLAAMLGLCGCLAGVQAQTILVELEVGKAGCCPTGRAARGDRQRAGIARGRRRRAGNRHFRPRRGRVLGACLDGRWTAHRLCVQSRASRRGAPTCRGRGAARAHSVGPEHARRRQHRHRRRRSVRPGPRPHRRAGRALSVSAGPHGTGRLGPHGAAGRAGRGDPDLAPA